MDNQVRESLLRLAAFIAGMAVCFVVMSAVYQCMGLPMSPPETINDTITVIEVKTDTLFSDQPVPVRERIIRYARVARVNDSLKSEHDTAHVLSLAENDNTIDSIVIPITQRVYTDDSTYTAWVSGYDAMLDSIETYRRRELTTNTIFVQSRKRWHVGIQGGVYATPKGLQPGIGLGFSFDLKPP